MEVKINGINFAPLVVDLQRKGRIIYSGNRGTTLANTEVLDPLGTKIYYTLTIDSMYKDQKLLERFWEEIIKPRVDGFDFEAPYNQTTLKFKAYIDNEFKQVLAQAFTDRNIWGDITVDIFPMKPQFEEVW